MLVSFALMILLTGFYGGDRKQQVLFVTAWIILIVVDAIGLISVQMEENHAGQRVRDMLDGLADHLAISLHELGLPLSSGTTTDDPLYIDAMELLSKWQRDANRIGALYTFTKGDDGRYYFILSPAFDNNRDGIISGIQEESDLPGTLYDVKDERIVRAIETAFHGENVITTAPYRDFWGDWITAYRPLKDARGNVVAVFGIDYRGEDWNRAILRARMGPSLFFYTFLFFFFLQLFYFIRQRREERNLRYYSRELERMVNTTEEIRLHQSVANRNKQVVLGNMYKEVNVAAEENTRSIREFELLCLGDRKDLQRHAENALKKIHRSGVEYLTLLDSIHNDLRTTVQKAGSRQETCHVRDHLNMLADYMTNKLRKKPDLAFEIKIHDNIPATVMVDHVRFRSILMALLDNAIRESRRGTIRLNFSIWNSMMDRSSGQEEESDYRTPSTTSGRFFLHDEEAPIFDQLSYLKAEVCDTARKFSEPLRSELFHPFSRTGTQASGKSHPVKIGLSVAWNMARIAGGKLRLIRRDRPGNTFLLLMPVVVSDLSPSAPEGAPETDSATSSGMSLADYRILVVDDNAANQVFVETILNNFGAQTEITDNGADTIELLLKERRLGRFFDLIVMDSQLSRIDGCDTATSIRNHGFMRPIVFIGSPFDKCDYQMGESDVILPKPVDRKILIQTIIRLTARQRRAIQHRRRVDDLTSPLK